MALFKIAWRNIKEHKVKTLIIGIMITLGITILVIGNSMMDTCARGIEKNYINSYTGNLIITGSSESRLTLLGAMDFDSFGKPLPTIPDFFNFLEFVQSLPAVEAVSPQGAGRAQLSIGEDAKSFALLFGIDPVPYRQMFPGNVEFIEGDFFASGEKGLILSEEVVSRFKEDSNVDIKVGDKILLTGFGSSGGAKIRELPVSGIFRFKNNSNPQLDMVSLIDMDSLRALNNMTLGAELEVAVSDEETSLIDSFTEDDLFGDDSSFFMEGDIIESVTTSSTALTEESLDGILGDTSDRGRYSQVDSGAWHFLLIKLKNPGAIVSVRNSLNEYIKEHDLLAEVADWKSGAGPMGEMADVLKVAFNIIVMVIAVVAVFIIMNTLVISVTERIPEIGTMRALGAHKSFIREMIIFETVMISGLFGLIGIGLGSLILTIMGLTGIPAPNMFFEIIFGGKVLYPVISVPSITMSFIFILLVGILSSLYPVSVALKIQPVKAIQTS